MKQWVKEEVEAVKINVALLHFDSDVHCETDEEVKTLCTVLALAQQWRIGELHLPDKMGAESWTAFNEVFCRGKVDTLCVSELTLSAGERRRSM